MFSKIVMLGLIAHDLLLNILMQRKSKQTSNLFFTFTHTYRQNTVHKLLSRLRLRIIIIIINMQHHHYK